MSSGTKDTIYIDIDDEITSVIDKLRGSKHKIVALVLPKRATVFQSIVNMKLLKRTATEEKKHVVLITSEAGLLPLAGAVGIHVAKTLQSKPSVPPKPDAVPATETVVTDTGDAEPEIDPKKSVGELAHLPPEEETIQVDDGEEDEPGSTSVRQKTKKPKNKKFKIPNFDKFRVRLFLGIFALILLIVGWYFVFVSLPKARIIIKTDTSSVTRNLTFTASAAAKEFDAEKSIIPAELKEVKKSENQKITTTGEKDVGTKAAGTMAVTNCINDGAQHTVPAGTSFTNGSFTFVSNEAVTLEPALYSGNNCRTDLGVSNGFTKNVGVTAAQGGDKYNLSARSYTSSISGVSGYGSNMTGGTSKLVKAVSQQDVDNAKQQLTTKAAETANQELTQALKDAGLVGLADTLAAGETVVSSSPKVGDEATEATVTATVTYSMFGVREAALKQFVEDDIKRQIDTGKQTIQDNGLAQAVFRILEKKSNTEMHVSVQVLAVAGPQLDTEGIKKEIAGKKRGQSEQIIRGRPGIKDVEISYSPFWVLSTPKKASKITVIFEQPPAQQPQSNDGN